jgi:hypothetical protein
MKTASSLIQQIVARAPSIEVGYEKGRYAFDFSGCKQSERLRSLSNFKSWVKTLNDTVSKASDSYYMTANGSVYNGCYLMSVSCSYAFFRSVMNHMNKIGCVVTRCDEESDIVRLTTHHLSSIMNKVNDEHCDS